jgi:hypothetical protein
MFHILTVGWDLDVIARLADPIEAATGFTFSHLLDPALDDRTLEQFPDRRFFVFRRDVRMAMPPADRTYLAALERTGVPTIHNMILGDPRLKTIDYDAALDYASFLARRTEELLKQVKPSVIIGGFDAVHSGIALAVARRLGIPWFAMNFTSMPLGMSGFCTEMNPGTSFSCLPLPPETLRRLAEATVREFEAKRIAVPAYLSANSVRLILRRLPKHFRFLSTTLARLFTGRYDRYTRFPASHLVRQYFRKRLNLIRLPKKWLSDRPTATPYFFFGLHLQPESSIDVWAPYFSDQLSVTEAIARSMPPSHTLYVKLHKSDADHYSPRELDRFRRLPGVQLVSPYANSRTFIEGASVVFAIQGNIALEAALLGRPVLMFGDSRFLELAGVTRVKRMTDLPEQIRAKLTETPPDRERIVRGLTSYLSHYGPGCYNDWEAKLSASDVRALADHFRALRDYLQQQSEVCAG